MNNKKMEESMDSWSHWHNNWFRSNADEISFIFDISKETTRQQIHTVIVYRTSGL